MKEANSKHGGSKQKTSLHYGRISELSPATGEARITLEDMDGMPSPLLKVLNQKTKGDRAYWMPEMDQLVAVILDEKGESGVILGGCYSEEDAVPISSNDRFHVAFGDGSTIDYDRASHKLDVFINGEINIEATGDVTIIGSRIDLNP